MVVVAFRNHSMCLPRLRSIRRHGIFGLPRSFMTDDLSSSNRCGCQIDGLFILLNIPIINYHPMVLLPSITPSNIADLFTKPLSLSRHRFTTTTLIGDKPTTPSTSVASTVDTITTASAAVDSVSTATPTSDSVPSNPNLDPAPTLPTLPIVVDTGASYSRAPSVSDYLPVGHASYGLFRSPISVVSKALASNPIDPYTLITGEDVSVVDLLSPDISTIIIDSDSGPFSGPSFTKVHFDVRQFGTASLTFIFSPNWSLIKVFVTPTQVDWTHWVPLPRLTPTESYFHIFGRDYLQAFVLLHLIPIWITLVSALVSALLRSE